LRLHYLDVKAKAYLKTNQLSVLSSNRIFMNSNNLTIKQSNLSTNPISSFSTESKIRLLAFGYLKIESDSNIKSATQFIKGDLGMSITGSKIESIIDNKCNID